MQIHNSELIFLSLDSWEGIGILDEITANGSGCCRERLSIQIGGIGKHRFQVLPIYFLTQFTLEVRMHMS